MAGLSLIALLDDIAAVLDDVALMTKVAAKKTAGVLGDDLALNAQQVSGVKAEREIPVVWAVAKGSFLNKLILVPLALLLSLFLPVAITLLLLAGGLFLCFEGFEKVFHKWFHASTEHEQQLQRLKANSDQDVDLVAMEKQKIKGAIRTDFILSAEIIVISLGTVADSVFVTQILVVASIAIAMTIGVYGLVAGIVKLDDAGFYLLAKANQKGDASLQKWLGRGLIVFAPKLMKFLVIVGTAAMFLVGGGILVHGIPMIADVAHHIDHNAASISNIGSVLSSVMPVITNAVVGILAGALTMAVVSIISSIARILGKQR
ncbi:DUF808 domain-containing protein [Echinimonas agarilytica]|uniref:DUF808 domain-containing protein n=1 Tax=Echinimonas agarilytica TaxID=1215918 RepID=A0AA42B8P6_9GAMM|nr:DUF808 domain-containing protein [Echinimonas agarilytica]MCM2681250.1 DUF808 domain-containing protein [Echinimonas agarilytica]